MIMAIGMKGRPGKASTRGPRSNHAMSTPGTSPGSKATVVKGIRTPFIQSKLGGKLGGGR